MSALEPNTETIKQASSGDLSAFEKIFACYEKYVLNLIYKIIYNKHDAEDIKQEVFLRIYKSLNTYKEEFSFKTWIYNITINTVSSYKLGVKKYLNLLENLKDALLLRHDKTEEDIHEKNLVQKILEKLPQNQRTLLVLREVECLSYEEIAGILNCSAASVKVKLFRARKSFLKHKRYYEEGGGAN